MTEVPDPADRRLGITDRILGEEAFVRRLALRLSRRGDAADDLAQEAMLRAWSARRRFRPGASVRAWLATIVRRVFLTSSATERRRRTQSDTDLGEPIETLSETGEVAVVTNPVLRQDAALEQLDDRLRRAFAELPEDHRTAFVLSALDGLTYAEIAERLGIPIGTVMSRVYRVRMRLREAAAEA